ncbi:hypothetical protein HPP92_006261 [Vanilla planifolia]|uniref:Uncharacterized protein n=1 Tax=Vanilla planifolia TaxID=51239 RepID=A0A835S0B7_VANPL|nr:hypothetical protein HPP92_006261 [Vanilla planifolia]
MSWARSKPHLPSFLNSRRKITSQSESKNMREATVSRHMEALSRTSKMIVSLVSKPCFGEKLNNKKARRMPEE